VTGPGTRTPSAVTAEFFVQRAALVALSDSGFSHAEPVCRLPDRDPQRPVVLPLVLGHVLPHIRPTVTDQRINLRGTSHTAQYIGVDKLVA
jgi:hypothetical protein